MLHNKWVLLGVIVVVSVVADQWTKIYAESRLASTHYPDHQMELTVPEAFDGKTVQEYLEHELSWSKPEHIELIAKRFTRTDERLRLAPSTPLKAGQKLELVERSLTVVDGYWDHIYRRNPGAAWSFMADADETFRKAFFIGTSFLTMGLILWFLYKAEPGQLRLSVALSLVLGGAIGNLIDRIAYGYVIDFIAWHVGDSYWPTFNIADAVIVAGVVLMAIELIFAKEEPKVVVKASKAESSKES